MGLTAQFMKQISRDVGDRVRIVLALSDEREPRELVLALRASGAMKRWLALTPAQRRQACENVRSTRRPETRRPRIAQILRRLA